MAFDSFQDARTIPQDASIEADLCIVGGGAAGITLARAFAGTSLRVCLLEAGGLSLDPEVTAASQVEDAGRPYDPDHKRLRYFGGTTNHWGGHCAPLEPEDFEAKPWIDGSGWPIGRADLEPYYRAAHEVLDLGRFDYDARRIAGDLGTGLMPFDGPRVTTQLSRYNRMRFSLAHGGDLDQAGNVRVILYADVSDIRLSEAAAESVSHVQVRSPAMNRFTVRARYFVLATGGIENARTLLNAHGQRPKGIGNQNDLVGRFFQDHLWFSSGVLAPVDVAGILPLYLSEIPYDGVGVRSHLILTAAESQRLRIGRFRAELSSVNDFSQRIGRVRGGGAHPRDILTLAANPMRTGHAMACGDAVADDLYMFHNYVQQVPNPDSRITLGDAQDIYGRRQPRLNWRLTAQDHDCIYAAQTVIAEEAGRLGFGRMRIDLDPEPPLPVGEVLGGAHHMGTTRMAADPSRGVADGDALVFGTRNLFLAGSSLFPTCGYINPTLTIVAMTLRLADHLGDQARRDGVL